MRLFIALATLAIGTGAALFYLIDGMYMTAVGITLITLLIASFFGTLAVIERMRLIRDAIENAEEESEEESEDIVTTVIPQQQSLAAARLPTGTGPEIRGRIPPSAPEPRVERVFPRCGTMLPPPMRANLKLVAKNGRPLSEEELARRRKRLH